MLIDSEHESNPLERQKQQARTQDTHSKNSQRGYNVSKLSITLKLFRMKKQIIQIIMLGAILSGIGSVYSGIQQRKDNKKAIANQNEQNQKDRDFQKSMWDETNAYNTPAEQMKRLEAGGLNPNLVYGGGSATHTASNFGLPQSKPLPAPRGGEIMGNMVNQLYDTTIKELQKDLTETEILAKTQQIAESGIRSAKMAGADTNKVIADTSLSEANTKKSIAETSLTGVKEQREGFELGKAETLLNTTLEQATANLKNMNLKNIEQDIVNSQLPEKHKMAVSEGISRIELNKTNKSARDINNELDKLRLQLRQRGIEISDPIWARMSSRVINNTPAMQSGKFGEHNAFSDALKWISNKK